ncbi:MAG: STAS domain-containing protein [Promicromonosporaceae bacterium]|nr:STAS domain-containing protein [Promicromonosporaceae bacterium]
MTITNLRVGGIDLVRSSADSVIVLWGAIDASLRGQASGALAGALARNLPIVVDVSQVDFMDSSGGAFIMQLAALGRDEGFSVEFRDPPPVVESLLLLTGRKYAA